MMVSWQLLSSLLLLSQCPHSVVGQAFFMDGAPGCSSNGYGITVDEFFMECESENEDGPCLFDDNVKIFGQTQLPGNVEVIPRICRRNGYSCTEPLLEYTYVDTCDYLEGGDCPNAGTSYFEAEMVMPSNDLTDYLYEWAEERQQQMEENKCGDDMENCEEEEESQDQEDCEDGDDDCEEQDIEEYVYAEGTVGVASAKFMLRVELKPVQDWNIWKAMYNGERWNGYNDYWNDDEEEQEQEEEEEEENQANSYQEYMENKEAAKEAYQEMVYFYMQEPSQSIYCHIPFRLVADEYNVTAYKERNSYYGSWFWRFMNGMLSDCEINWWTCNQYEEQENSNSYSNSNGDEGGWAYYAGVGVVAVFGGLLYRKKRATITAAGDSDEGIAAMETTTSKSSSSSRSEPVAVEGDTYVTMS